MVHIVNKKIIDFFVLETTKFINAMILSIPDNQEKSLAMDKYQYIREQAQ